MRFRREDDRLNLEIDPTEGNKVDASTRQWDLVLPKNLGVEDFVGAIVTMKSEAGGIVMDIRFPVYTVMSITMPNNQANIVASAEFSAKATGDAAMRSTFMLSYVASTGNTVIKVTANGS